MIKTFTNDAINEAMAYLLINETEKKAILIDTAMMAKDIVAYLKENDLALTDVLITHYHLDHTMGLDLIQTTFHPTIHICNKDFKYLFDAKTNGEEKTGNKVSLVKNDDFDLFTEEKTLQINGFDIEFIPFGGHTPGTTFYRVNNEYAFIGDTLFKNGIGFHNKNYNNLVACDDERFYDSLDYIMENFRHLIICSGHHEPMFQTDDVLANPHHEYHNMRK